LAACARPASIPLEGTEWTLASLHGDEPAAGTSLTLAFYEDNYLEGSAGCNHYGANYAASDQGFRMSEIGRTRFECEAPPGIMPQDHAFFEALASIAAYHATEDRLEFRNTRGQTVLVYARKLPPVVDAALANTEWLLTSLFGNSLLEESRITLNLGEDGFEGFAGCNNYGGEYEAADEGKLLMSDTFLTAMDCPSPEGIVEQETAYIEALNSSATYRVTNDRLEIADASGEVMLAFTRKDAFGTDPSALVHTAWRLVSIDDDRSVAGSAVTLAFYSETILGGHAGCRDYLATYEATGDDLRLLYEVMLDAGCEPDEAALEQEAQFLAILAPKADVQHSAGRLEIYGERGGLLVFESLPEEAGLDLKGPTWSLQSFVGPNPFVEEPDPWPVPVGVLPETTITIALEGETAQGSAGCNSYGAAVSHSGPSMSFGAITMTEMACLDPEGVMDQEARYAELLGAITGYRIYGDRLWMETSDGRALLFAPPGP
jgi:heat shock protein HslJ